MTKLLLPLFLTLLPVAARGMPLSAGIEAAAESFLESLGDEARSKATTAFSDEERENWHFVPMKREGLALKDMNESQKNAAVALANAVLSEEGTLKAAQIISLEAVLAELENDPRKRDPEKYWVLVFGEPGDHHGWGFRFEGHHLSLNITLIDDRISVTPSFLGANPAEVREGPKEGLRPLAAEEDKARALAKSLSEAGKQVVFRSKPPRDVVTGQDSEAEPPELVGVTYADMNDGQQGQLIDLIETYLNTYREEIASDELKAIREDGLDEIRFGWAGGLQKGEAYYYRVQGADFLMEAANTQNDVNHIHAVWRKFDGDFGRDLLREHMKSHEH